MERLKSRTIDSVLKTLTSKQPENLRQLVFSFARFIQYDLCLSFHCDDEAKISAYRHFLSDNFFIKHVFKVSFKIMEKSEKILKISKKILKILKIWKKIQVKNFDDLKIENLGPLLVTKDEIDVESIAAHLKGEVPRKRTNEEISGDSQDNDRKRFLIECSFLTRSFSRFSKKNFR